MATKLFLRQATATTHLGTNSSKLGGVNSGWVPRSLSTTAGAGVTAKTANTVAGTTLGVEITDTAGGNPIEWLSPPVSADVTISGAITGNLWSSENNMSANVAINFQVDVVRATDNTITSIVKSARVTEVAVTTRAVNNFTATPAAGVTVNRGDRIRVRIFGDDAGTMGTGFTFDLGYDGGTGGADGDSFLSFTETFAFESDPAGTVLYLTDTASALDALVNTGFTAGGTYISADRAGAPAWSNPTNASASDDTYATVIVVAGGSDYLVGYNWGFALAAGSIVRGIEVEVEGKTTLASDTLTVQFGVQELGIFTPNGTSKSVVLTSTESTQTAGASDDVWGHAWTEAEIEDNVAFGVGVWSTSGSAETVSIDLVRVKVYYAPTALAKEAWTSRGGGVVSKAVDTTTGWTAPLQWTAGSGHCYQEWYSRRLTAFTLTGMAKANLRLLESSASAQASAKCEIARTDSDGANATVWAAWCLSVVDSSATDGELSTSERAETVYVSGDALTVSDGQRLRIRIYLDDTPATALATAFTSTLYYAGTSGGASGDSFLTLAQSVTELAAKSFIIPHRHRSLIIR